MHACVRSFISFSYQSVWLSVRHSASHSVIESCSSSVIRSLSQSAATQPASQPTNQSASQPASQPVSQSANQTVSQSANSSHSLTHAHSLSFIFFSPTQDNCGSHSSYRLSKLFHVILRLFSSTATETEPGLSGEKGSRILHWVSSLHHQPTPILLFIRLFRKLLLLVI